MKWNIDPHHTDIQFAVRYFGISLVRGCFRRFEGVAETDGADSVATVHLKIEAASIDTNQEQRDAALRSEHFFDVDRYPRLTFDGIVGVDRQISGRLAMRGATLPVQFTLLEKNGPMTDPQGRQRIGCAVEGSLDRSRWGVSGNMTLPSGEPAIGADVLIRIDLEAIAEP